MITLKNHSMEIHIDENNNANIIFLAGNDSCNLLDKKGLCAWLKSGKRQDQATGVLGNFHKNIFREPMAPDELNENSATFSRNIDGLLITKKITLAGNILNISLSVKNVSAENLPQMQLEYFNMFAGGRLQDREGSFTSIIEKGKIKDFIESANYGERYVKCFPYDDTSIIVGNTGKEYFLKISSAYDCEAVTAMVHGNTLTRGFNSRKFTLPPGKIFEHGINLEIGNSPVPSELLPSEISRARKLHDIPDPSSFLNGTPAFRERWSHLCIQYDKTDPADVKKIVSGILARLKYTGVVFEFDRGLKTSSHPELAEEWAWSMETAKDVVAFARDNGLKIGVEFDVPGHQNETGIEKIYPDLMECRGTVERASALCTTNQQARKIVKDVYEEYQEIFQPDLILFGGDEVQFEGHSCTLGLCPECRKKMPADLFRDYLAWLLTLVKKEDTDVLIYGDMFLQSAQFGPAVSGNGTAGDAWKSLDGLSARYTIADWHYYPCEHYGSLGFFREKGYNVIPVTAFHREAMRLFLLDAERRGIQMALHTTWGVPNQEKLPVETMVWASIYHWLGKKADELPVEEVARNFCLDFW